MQQFGLTVDSSQFTGRLKLKIPDGNLLNQFLRLSCKVFRNYYQLLLHYSVFDSRFGMSSAKVTFDD
jgi:hypothetical protein